MVTQHKRNSKKNRWLPVAACFFFLWGTKAMAESPEARVGKAMEGARAAQEKTDAFREEAASIRDEIRRMKTEADWYTFRNRKLARQIRHEEAAINALSGRKAAAEELRRNLAPYLDEVAKALSETVTQGAPYLKTEREKRIQDLGETLDRYGVSLGERLQAVLEALEAEVSLGMRPESGPGKVEINGEEQEGTLFHCGGVGLFFLSPDAAVAARFDGASGHWLPMDGRGAKGVKNGIRISEKQAVAEPVILPLSGGDA